MLVLTFAAEGYSHGVTDEISVCVSIIIPQSAFQRVHNLFQNEFSKHFHLVLPPSISSIFSLSYGHPVAAYVFIVFPSLYYSFIFPRIMCFRMQFLCKMWPTKLAFILFTVRGMFYPPWLCVILLHFSYSAKRLWRQKYCFLWSQDSSSLISNRYSIPQVKTPWFLS